MRRTAAVTLLIALVMTVGPYARFAQAAPAADAAALDTLVRAAWQQKGLTPVARTDDARFLRRIYLQIIGTIPPPQVITDFLADRSPDKRARAVDALLADPRYADHWTEYWDSVLMGKATFAPNVDRQAFRNWLHNAFAENVPYNRFVYELITATGQNSTGPTYAEAQGLGMAPGMMAMQASSAAPAPSMDAGKVNGAVNWHIRYSANPADLSGVASKIFMGVQIQCAQCHDHKTEKWKQDDFRRFTACFVQTVPLPVGGVEMARKTALSGHVVQLDMRDINFPYHGNQYNGGADREPYVAARPAALDGTPITGLPADRRKSLAAWMTAKENPWFAQAIVNRIWAKFLGRGFVEPIDDFRPSNPAILPDALKLLADDFVAHDYDLKYLIRTITATEIYQLSAAPPEAADPTNTLWSRFHMAPLGTDEMLNSLVAATNFQAVLTRYTGGDLRQIKARIERQLNFLFDTDEPEAEQKDFEGTIPQALLLLNGSLTNAAVTPIPGTALADVLAMPGGDAEKIDALYLRTVSREPTRDEIQRWIGFINRPREVVITPPAVQPPVESAGKPTPGMKARAAGTPLAGLARRAPMGPQSPKLQAYEDLFWALLNSSEFMFNH